jgi:alkylated DNA nucleotide flippase Atl1
VLDLVEHVPAGRATTYGDLATIAAEIGGVRVTARAVGRIMATADRDVPWWRVVAHDGRLPPGLEDEARRRLHADGCPMRGDRVDLSRARWQL